MRGGTIMAGNKNWKQYYEQDIETFITSLCSEIEKGHFQEVKEGVNTIYEEFLHALTSNFTENKEKVDHALKEIYKSLQFLRTTTPGFFALKGKVEVMTEVTKTLLSQSLDVRTRLELQSISKYSNQILLYLLNQHHSSTKAIADYLNMAPPQLTGILDKLEDKEYIVRIREGKYIFNRLTKTGLMISRALEQEDSSYDIYEIIKALKDHNVRGFERKLESFMREHGEKSQLIKVLKELHEEQLFKVQLRPMKTIKVANQQVDGTKKELFSVKDHKLSLNHSYKSLNI